LKRIVFNLEDFNLKTLLGCHYSLVLLYSLRYDVG